MGTYIQGRSPNPRSGNARAGASRRHHHAAPGQLRRYVPLQPQPRRSQRIYAHERPTRVVPSHTHKHRIAALVLLLVFGFTIKYLKSLNRALAFAW